MHFEWDENKNKINQRKHGVSFEEAVSVFYDDEALVIDDPDHSDFEERFIILGLSRKANRSLSVTATVLLIPRFELYRLEKPQEQKVDFIKGKWILCAANTTFQKQKRIPMQKS